MYVGFFLVAGALSGAVSAEFSQGPVYVAYAGPYSASPSSAFGHLFLVVPEAEDQPVPLWDVISFGAEPPPIGVLGYVIKGIAGGFEGRYRHLAFHENTHRYEALEDRDVWLVQLRLSSSERADLNRAVADLDRSHPYDFFHRNCAFYIHELLAQAIDLPPPGAIVSPLEVVRTLHQHGRVRATFFREARSYRLERLRDANQAALDDLLSRGWHELVADSALISGLTRSELRFLHEYVALRLIHESAALDPAVRGGVAHLRRLVAANPAIAAPGNPVGQLTELDFHTYGRSRSSLQHRTDGSPQRISIGYRGALHDGLDPTFGHRPLNRMTFLAADMSVQVDGSRPRVDRVVLLSQRAMTPSSWTRERHSWLLEALGRRGDFFGPSRFQLELRGGYGRTMAVADNLFVYGMGTAGTLSLCCKEATVAVGGEVGIAWHASPAIRVEGRANEEHDVADWNRSETNAELFLRIDVASGLGIVAGASHGRYTDLLILGLDIYH